MPQTVNFSADQGTCLLDSLRIWQEKDLVLIGPPASAEVFGRHFFHGPLIYYLVIALMTLSSWDPIKASMILIVVNFFGVIIFYQAVRKLLGEKIGLLSLSFLVFSPVAIDYSKFIWNPNFLLFLTPVYLFLVAKILEKDRWYYFLSAGLIAGMGLQLHFQFALIILFSPFLFLVRRKKLFNILIFLLFSFMGYLPLIVFDLRNRFYNLKTIIDWIRIGAGGGLKTHYFLSFLPLLFILASYFLVKIVRGKKQLIILIIFTLSLYSYLSVFGEKQAFGMPKNWDYLALKKAVKIISENGDDNFNVVNLLSGDTRFYSLRYLLTISGKPPLSVESYPEADQLFVVSEKSAEEVKKDSVWEISSFVPTSVIQTWDLNGKIKLYELAK